MEEEQDNESMGAEEMEKCSFDQKFVAPCGFQCAACKKRETIDNMRICISCYEDGEVLVKPGEVPMCSCFIFCTNCIIDNHVSKGHRQKLFDCDMDLKSIQELKKTPITANFALVPMHDEQSMRSSKRRARMIRLIRQHLAVLLHAQQCAEAQCVAPYCDLMKDVLHHQLTCSKVRECPYAHCYSSDQILDHWTKCSGVGCVLCAPLRRVASDVTGLPTEALAIFIDHYKND